MIRYLIVPILIGIISSFLFSAAQREARRTETAMDENDFVIRQPKTFLNAYIAVTVFFFLLYVFVLIGEYDGGTMERWWINLLAMSPFLALGPFLAILWYRWKITVKGNQITALSYFGKERTFTFDCITKVEYGTQLGKMGSINYIKAYHEKKKVLTVSNVCLGFQVLLRRFKMLGLVNTPENEKEEKQEPKAKPALRTVALRLIGVAIITFILIYRNNVPDPIDPNKEAAREAYTRGAEAERKKDYDLAVAEYTEAIRLAPDDNSKYKYYSYRARLYEYRTREYDKAIADYKEALKFDDNYMVYYSIGDLYFKLEDFANAISYYEQSLQLKPDNPELKEKLEITKWQAK